MSDIVTSSFQDESLSITLNYQPPNLVNVEDDINQTRVILRQPATIVNFGDKPLLEYADVANSASYAKSASYIADDSDIYDWVRTTFYVSSTDGNDDNNGKTLIYPFKTIKRAARAAAEFITGSRLAFPNLPEEAPRVTIRLSTGFYEEEAPITIPEWTSVCGNDLRTCVVRPTYETRKENLFLVNRGFYADGLRLEGCEIDDLTNPRSGFFFAFTPGAYITTSPYIQNCTSAFVPFDKFYAPLDAFATPQPNPEIGNGPGGMIVDDSVLDPYSPLKSMIVDAYTQVAFNGIGLVARGAGYAQMVSFFTNFSHVGTWSIDGGHASLLNSNTTFGDYGLRAEGYRVIVVPDYDGVNSYQSEEDSLILSSSIADVQAYMMNQLQLSGSYRTDYVDSESRIYRLTMKDSGLLVNALATDLLALTPGKTVNWIQSQFKGQDVSPDKRYTLPTASGFEKGPVAAFRVNDNTYSASVPFTETSASRDTGYIIDGLAADILYGGNERSVESGVYFYKYPSPAITTQLQPTLDGVFIIKGLAQNVLESINQDQFVPQSNTNIQTIYNIIENGTGSLPVIDINTNDAIRVTSSSTYYPTSSAVTSSIRTSISQSYGTIINTVDYGTGSLPTLINNAKGLVKFTSSSQFTTASTAGAVRAGIVTSSFNIIANMIENGTGSAPTLVANTAGNIRLTATTLYTSSSTASVATVNTTDTLVSIVSTIIRNGTGSLPTLVENTLGNIKFTNTAQIISSSAANSNEITKVSASYATIYDIIYNGTGSTPAIIENTSESIKFTTSVQITSASSAGNAEVTKVSASYYDIYNAIEYDTGSLPVLIQNTNENIQFTNTSQVTSASAAGIVEITKVSSSYYDIAEAIEYDTGSLPPLIENTDENIQFTNTSPITSASSAEMAEVTKVSASYYDIYNAIEYDTGSLPSLVLNTNENIRYTDSAQYITASFTGSVVDLGILSSSFGMVMGAILNGTGSLPSLVPYTTQSTDLLTVTTYNLIIQNISFIQDEMVAWLSSSWSSIEWQEDKARRDIGYIVSGAAEDLLWGGNSASLANSIYFNVYPSEAIGTGSLVNQTIESVNYASRLALKVAENVTFVTASESRRSTYNLLKANIPFLQDEMAAYLSSSWSSIDWLESKARRDTLYIIDNIATDVYYGGNERTLTAAQYFYKYPSAATGSLENQTLDGIRYVSRLAQNVIQNTPFTTASLERKTAYNLLKANIPFIQDEVIAYLSSSWSSIEWLEGKARRDTLYIIDNIATDVYYGGNERTIESAKYFYKYPSAATGSLENQTLDGIRYASRLAQKVIQNISFTTASLSRKTTYNLLKANIPFIQNEVSAYLSSSWSSIDWLDSKARRDTLYIVDNIATDIYYGGNERTIESAKYFYKYPSAATGSLENQTLDGIRYASRLAQKVIQNVSFTTASLARKTAYNLLKANTTFLQNEVAAYLSSSWSSVDWLEGKAKRDTLYIVDNIATDILYGGNERTVTAAQYFYKYPSAATGSLENQTLDGIKYVSRVAQKVMQNITFTTASLSRKSAWTLLRANTPFIQDEVVAYLSSSWTTIDWMENKARRDTKYVLDAVATDIYYGGNERSITAGEYFYIYPSAATGSLIEQTIEGVNYIKGLAKKVIVNTPFTYPTSASRAAKELLVRNKQFIQNEVVAYLTSSWSSQSYSLPSSSRDVGYLIDNVATDVLYGGNERSIIAGTFFHKYPSVAITTELDETITGVTYAKHVAEQIVLGNVFQLVPSSKLQIRDLLLQNKPFIQDEVVAYTDRVWPNFGYSEAKTRRDTGYLIDAVVTDFVYGGNERAREAGRFFYKYPSLAISTQKAPTLTGITYGAHLADKILSATTFTTASSDRIAAYNALKENKSYIQEQVVIQLKTNKTFDEDRTVRDSGYIVQAVATDILYGGNERATEAGRYFYKFPSAVLNAVKSETLEGIALIKEFAQNYLENTISESEIPKLRNEVDIVYDILENGTGSIATTLITNASGATRFTTASQFTSSAIISSSVIESASNALQAVLDIIEYGTGSIPPLVKNTSGRIKKSGVSEIQYTGSLSQSIINLVTASTKITVDILDYGTGSIPEVIPNTINNIKVNNITQYTGSVTASSTDIQNVSSSFGLVTQIITDGTSSLPSVIPYTTQSTNPSTIAAYNILKNNIPLIQAEVISYISSSWSTASYNEASCSRDVGYIVSGAAEDLLYGSNSASLACGTYYYVYPSQATTTQLNFTVDGIRYANNLVQKLLTNTILSLPSDDQFSAYKVARENREFIRAEIVPYISSSWSTLNYNTSKCERDVDYIVDGITTDFLYGGNERSIESGRYYYLYNVSEVTGEQVEETTTGIRYIGSLIEAIMQGATFQYPTQNQLDAAELLFNNKQFIAEEIIPYVSASWTGSTYNAEKCKRDVGYIIDGVITDIVYGGNERSIESGLSYYLYPQTPSPAVNSERDYTYAGTRYLKGMAIEVLKNTVFQPVTTVRQTAYNILTENKTAIAQAVLQALLDKQEKCMVCDYLLAHNKIREYILDDPDGKFTELSAPGKVKIGQMMAMVTGTLESVVLDLQPTYLQEFGSLITSTSHVFEFGGSGANYLALPGNQYGIGQSNFDIRVFQSDGGRVYTSFGDETGDFFVGLDFTIRQATGTIEGRTFNKATAARFTPLILALT